MTLYDRIAHTIGAAALGLLGASASGHVPGWLIILASVVAFATGVTTNPVVGPQKPASSSAVLNLLFIGTVALCASCAHAALPVTTFGHCSTAALETAAQGILGRVTTALATGDYVDQLATLAAEVGGAEVGCAVDLVIAEFSAKAARTDDTEVNVILAHAQAWRGSNP